MEYIFQSVAPDYMPTHINGIGLQKTPQLGSYLYRNGVIVGSGTILALPVDIPDHRNIPVSHIFDKFTIVSDRRLIQILNDIIPGQSFIIHIGFCITVGIQFVDKCTCGAVHMGSFIRIK